MRFDQPPEEKPRRWQRLTILVCLLAVAGLVTVLVRLNMQVEQLTKDMEQTQADAIHAHRAAYVASLRSDERERRIAPSGRPSRRLTRAAFKRNVGQMEIAFNLPVPEEARPVRGSLEIDNRGNSILCQIIPTVNGRHFMGTSKAIVDSVVVAGASDKEKAFALFQYLRQHRYNWFPSDNSMNAGIELHNPVKFLNVYGYGWCNDAAHNLAMLWRVAGLKARAWGLQGHVVPEVFYNEGWHILDPTDESFHPTRDNLTVASAEQIRNEPYLFYRTKGLYAGRDMRLRYARYYGDDDNKLEIEFEDKGHNQSLNLMPGERFVQHWQSLDRDLPGFVRNGQTAIERPWWSTDMGATFHAVDDANAPLHMGRADFIWDLAPGSSRAAAQLNAMSAKTQAAEGIAAMSNVRLTHSNLVLNDVEGLGFLASADRQKPMLFDLYRRVPFVLVGGGLFHAYFAPTAKDDWAEVVILRRADAMGEASVAVSRRFTGAGGARTIMLDFDRAFSRDYPSASYEYGVRIILHSPGGGGLGQLHLEARTQTTPFSPFVLKPGANKVRVTVKSRAMPNYEFKTVYYGDPSLQRITSAPVGIKAEITRGGRIRLVWKAAATNDKKLPAWYQIQVSPRKDFLWPIAPDFDTHIEGGQTEWESSPGFLILGRTYYWRVRAKDGVAFASQWSQTLTCPEDKPVKE
jgi:outer membrane murein-binding lipoprotein Lpp